MREDGLSKGTTHVPSPSDKGSKTCDCAFVEAGGESSGKDIEPLRQGERFPSSVGEENTSKYQPQPIASAILKIGRYIATTINPITTPRNTIMMGSNNDVSEATA